MSTTFDPTKHLRQLRGKGGTADYLDVKWRLVWLRAEHPDATSTVEHVEISPDIAIFRATVTIPGAGSATDYGSETPKDFGDYIEKAATKALGRALAQLGYGTQFVGFEMDENTRIVDSPVDRRTEDDDGHAASQPRREPEYPPQGRTLDEALSSGVSPVERRPRPIPARSQAARPAPPAAAPPAPNVAAVREAMGDQDYYQTPEGAIERLQHATTREDANVYRKRCQQLGIEPKEWQPIYNDTIARIGQAERPASSGG